MPWQLFKPVDLSRSLIAKMFGSYSSIQHANFLWRGGLRRQPYFATARLPCVGAVQGFHSLCYKTVVHFDCTDSGNRHPVGIPMYFTDVSGRRSVSCTASSATTRSLNIAEAPSMSLMDAVEAYCATLGRAVGAPEVALVSLTSPIMPEICETYAFIL